MPHFVPARASDGIIDPLGLPPDLGLKSLEAMFGNQNGTAHGLGLLFNTGGPIHRAPQDAQVTAVQAAQKTHGGGAPIHPDAHLDFRRSGLRSESALCMCSRLKHRTVCASTCSKSTVRV